MGNEINSLKNSNKNLGYIEGLLSIIVNLVLFVLKLWAGIANRSIAIIADAWHTLSDSLTSIVVLVGLKIAAKPADKDHPFGHGRMEQIASVIIGILLILVAVNFMTQGIEKLVNRESTFFGLSAVIVTIISIAVKEALAQFAFFAGKRINSASVKADAWHHRSDAISSVVVLLGIFLGPFFWWIDGALGVLVALLILWAAVGIIKETIGSLLGEAPDKKLIQTIQEHLDRIEDFSLSFHHIHLHRYGDHKELTFHIELPGEISLYKAHEIANRIEDSLRKELGIEVTIHMEPVRHRES
ncbi:MAG: cation transporter [Spirochaetales bacterium]|nr:cation transporter [Spirochaetales bacterium]